jgi:phage N-6-adenine-methyltransferase
MSKMTHISNTAFPAWRTPRALARNLVHEYQCGIDAAADYENAVCPIYFDEEIDGLTARWCNPSIWLNPPYNAIPQWLAKAEAEVAAGNCERVVMLVPASVGTGWFTRAYTEHEIHLFNKRIAFDLPEGSEVKRSQPGFGNCLVIIQRDGLVGVTAMRDSVTGHMLHDYTEDPA